MLTPTVTKSSRAMSRARLAFTIGMAMLSALPIHASAQTAPETMHSCVNEPDPGRRLACYDRQMGRSPATAAPQAPAQAPVPAQAPPRAQAPPPEKESPPVQTAPPAQVPAPAYQSAAPAAGAAPEGTAAPAASPHPQTGEKSRTRSARIVSIDREPNEMVLHLDNGEVWEQLQGASGDLSLQPGDTVRIERRFGAYYLFADHVNAMRVRQQR